MESSSLTDVPETMLWTLHNRASEALRTDGIFKDEEAVRIYKSISYDYERSFGEGDPSHALRSAMFDHVIRTYLTEFPDAVVVNLGEGLETQRFRILTPETLWLSVDLPEAMEMRERFIQPDEQHKHVGRSVLDRAWFDEVPEGRRVIITGQGLFMYLEEEALKSLFADMAVRFPGGLLIFDIIPRWISKKTMSAEGWKKTPHYSTPHMPWGINRNEVEPTLHSWTPNLKDVSTFSWWRFPRGFT